MARAVRHLVGVAAIDRPLWARPCRCSLLSFMALLRSQLAVSCWVQRSRRRAFSLWSVSPMLSAQHGLSRSRTLQRYSPHLGSSSLNPRSQAGPLGKYLAPGSLRSPVCGIEAGQAFGD
ncbi:hypothetical protein SKAU_G00358830 [Synaphobranchus kaupii]|uniref:Uncharacterized protein n=1 Tax=Synaphobranchus kaupii TaxID=118154 RepID=A0A9Q1EHX9_SYNKA|nr:hypothetical protein SKAU_G00358830 [Synaphobranchus kaupii]